MFEAWQIRVLRRTLNRIHCKILFGETVPLHEILSFSNRLTSALNELERLLEQEKERSTHVGTHICIGQPIIKVSEYEPHDVSIEIVEVSSPEGATPPYVIGLDGNLYDEPTNHVGLSIDTLPRFARQVGLEALFLDEDTGFLRHADCGPIATLLTSQHLTQFMTAREHMQAVAPERTGDIGFLAWLIYWTEWALAHCETPTIWIF